MIFSWQRSTENSSPARGKSARTIGLLLDGARKGEKEDLSALYRHFLPYVFGYIAARVPDRSTAEDLTADVFLKMVEGMQNVRATDEASFAAWLIQVARLTVAGYYRKQEQQPVLVALEAESGEIEKVLANHPDADPASHAEVREEVRAVVQAINTLTEDQRQVLVGRIILGYDLATVARFVGKSTNTVKVLQFRALRTLRLRLARDHLLPTILSLHQEEAP